jgi:hypothetical protein
MKLFKKFFKSKKIAPHHQEQNQKTPRQASPPKVEIAVKATTSSSSSISNRATRGSISERSVYSSPSPRISELSQRLVDAPAKTAIPLKKKKPINIFNVLNHDVLNIVLNKFRLQHSQQIVLDREYIGFYTTSFKLLVTMKTMKTEDIERNLLSNLHTIYLDKMKINPYIIRILEKTLKYCNITTIILNTIEFPSDEDANEFFSFLQKNAPKLENLIIRASPKISNENIVKLIKCIRELKKLVLLEFSGFDVRDAYKGNFSFDDMFINMLIFLPDLDYLVFNNNIIDEDQYRRLFISTYAISAPKYETYLKDRYNMYIKSERMKFYDNTSSVRIPSYFFDLIKFRYADEKADVQIYRDIFFYTAYNRTKGYGESSSKYLESFNTNPVLNKYRKGLLSKYPKELAIPIYRNSNKKKI